MTTARLMLAGGTGRLVRRPSVVLFDPSGQNQDLANRFDAAASDSDAVDDLKKHLIESGFTAAPLVVTQWDRGEFNLLVFGDVEVHTSAIAAPMVSGAGSSTWVERHLGAIELGAATKVEVWSGSAADPTTNLGLGVVACAGFRMSLDLADLGATPADEIGKALSIAAPPRELRLPTPDGVPAAHVSAPAAFVEPNAAPTPGDAVSEWADTEDEALAAESLAADVIAEADPFTRNDIAPATPPASPSPTPSSAPIVDPFGSADAAPAEAPRAGLIEAAHCPQGHPNPPRTSHCYLCGESLLEDQSLGLIEQPAVGRIVFAGGQELPLERAVMMGRKPDAAANGAHPVLIDHVEVSRSHALVTIEGWTVLITDQGSRNGTWVTPASDPTAVRLDEQVPHVLEHGTTVHLGAPEVLFTYYFDSP